MYARLRRYPRCTLRSPLELFRHIKVRKPEGMPLQVGAVIRVWVTGNANSTARYDYTLRMINWFIPHLK